VQTINISALVLLILSFAWGTGFAQESGYQPPRTVSGKPDFQGFWSNASLTQMQRSKVYPELVIPADKIEEFTRNHHQNVRQATDDGLVQGALLDGSDLGSGRGYNAFLGRSWNKICLRKGDIQKFLDCIAL
jgi:hypothetical protein